MTPLITPERSIGSIVADDYCSAAATNSTAMHMLHEFEEDLHRHVHLENNILFL